MDLNEYMMRQMIESRLADARARGDRARLLGSVSRAPGLRVTVGRTLIEVGRWVAGARSGGPQLTDPTPEGRRV